MVENQYGERRKEHLVADTVINHNPTYEVTAPTQLKNTQNLQPGQLIDG